PSTPQFSLFPYTTLFRSVNPHCSSSSPVFSLHRLGAFFFKATKYAGSIPLSVTCRRKASFFLGSPWKRTSASVSILSDIRGRIRSEEHTSELQSRFDLVC